MFNTDLHTEESIQEELQRTEEITFVSSLYQIPTWRIKQRIRQGVSLYQMEEMFDVGAEI